MTEFGKRLRELRIGQGYTQQGLAEVLGVSKSAISMYENGVREPELELIQRMADLFSVNLECLIGNRNEEEKEEHEALESPFVNMKRLIARNGNRLTEEERNKLIELLSDFDL